MTPKETYDAMVSQSDYTTRGDIISYYRDMTTGDPKRDAMLNDEAIGWMMESGVEGADQLVKDGVFGDTAVRVFGNVCDAAGVPKDDDDAADADTVEQVIEAVVTDE